MAEDFGKLLEHYLTGSLEKYYSDFDYIDMHETRKKRVGFYENQYIEIDDFVEYYLKEFLCFKEGNVKGLTHAALRKLTDGHVVGIDNDFAFYNQEYIRNYYLIVVLDHNGDFGTYLNPILLAEYIKTDAAKDFIDQMKRTVWHDMKAVRDAFIHFQIAVETYEKNAAFYEQMDHLITASNAKYKVRKLKGEKDTHDKH